MSIILDAFVTTSEIPKQSKRVPPLSFPGNIGALALGFIDYKLSQRCMMTTIDNYKRLLSYFIASLNMKGKDGIAQISESDVLEFLGVKESSQSRHSTMRQFYEFIDKFPPGSPQLLLFVRVHPSLMREKIPSTYTKEEVRGR